MTTPVAALNPKSLLITPLDQRLLDSRPEDSSVIRAALLFAIDAHRNQERKYTKEPYVNHPIDVANRLNNVYQMLFKVNAPTDMVVAALLHDVVEDCGVKYSHINLDFGTAATTYVWWLTDEITLDQGNRDLRKMLARQKLIAAPVEVRVLKHFDNVSNTVSIREHDPEHYRHTYAPEIALLSKGMGTQTVGDVYKRLGEVHARTKHIL